MSAFLTWWPVFWAQANNVANNPVVPRLSQRAMIAIQWLFLASDPSVGVRDSLLGGALTWIKAIGLICLVCWVVSWLIVGIKERIIAQGRWFDYLGLAAAVLTPASVALKVLEDSQRMARYRIGTYPLTTLAAIVCIVLFVAWAEIATLRTLRRVGRRSDVLVHIALHVALALGVVIGFSLYQSGVLLAMVPIDPQSKTLPRLHWMDGLNFGVRFGGTYMGYVVLFRVAWELVRELILIRGRRLYSIARLSVYESTRKMWAPWVVGVVFLLVLAFTHWFLEPPRAAEMGRLYVGTLSLLCSILLTVMVTIMTPLSLPTDIQQQTIYTVVSKPVRRIELIWGRMLGYMFIVTVLMLAFGGISLFYLQRTVGGKLAEIELKAKKAKEANHISEYKQHIEQADQLRVRMQARVPIKGSLSFLDAHGKPHAIGIDVGAEQPMKEPRSHIEGATPSTAIWRFGRAVPDPFAPPGRFIPLDRQIPVRDFIFPGTVEWDLDRVFTLASQIDAAGREKEQPGVSAARLAQLDAAIARNQQELGRARGDYEALLKRLEDLKAKAADLVSSGKKGEAAAVRKQAAALSSPPIKVEMTFNVYRTTKGKIGEPVYAEIEAINPITQRKYEGDVFPIKEYYTNQVTLPASILAGSDGSLQVQIRCLTHSQYLGMGESDLYLLSSSGNFGFNYMKGLFGVWLQAMVLTAIGVFAGTFLSWPVALLTTIFFFVAGQLAFAFLVDISRQAVLGGGPFESLIRIVSHDNQMSELTPTGAVVLAKTLDSLAMPVMSRIVYLVPNFQALDVSNLVADGFMVSWRLIVSNLLLAVGYALPFSFAGYLILKNREVAA
jgi:hypothetical protein